MKTDYESIIQTIDSPVEGERTVVVACFKVNNQSHLELRTQSYGGDHAGWFTQNTTSISANQVSALRAALGIGSALPEMIQQAKIDEKVSKKQVQADENCHLKIWQAESA
ncbi:MAG: hypothetical protein COA78_37570 [Blastopirellula sp.]|nr:MAG: hypothetical protein COA78_37570 [Blastopirellula sp.]